MKQVNEFKREEKAKIREVLLEKAGYVPRSYIEQAFTRSSYSSQYGGKNNEEFEFIGDSVLNYYVVKILTDRFRSLDNEHYFCLKINYNKLDTIKKQLVSNENLAKIIDDWDIVKYLIVGKSDIQNHIDEQVKVKADLFEAILGAIAVQCDFDSKELENVVFKMLSMDKTIDIIVNPVYKPKEFTIDNAVNTLKELAEQGEISMPTYNFTGPKDLGYDEKGNPKWGSTLSINSDGIRLSVMSSSKKDAKKAAAYLALTWIYDGIPNEFGPCTRHLCWKYYDGNLELDISK